MLLTKIGGASLSVSPHMLAQLRPIGTTFDKACAVWLLLARKERYGRLL